MNRLPRGQQLGRNTGAIEDFDARIRVVTAWLCNAARMNKDATVEGPHLWQQQEELAKGAEVHAGAARRYSWSSQTGGAPSVAASRVRTLDQEM